MHQRYLSASHKPKLKSRSLTETLYTAVWVTTDQKSRTAVSAAADCEEVGLYDVGLAPGVGNGYVVDLRAIAS